MWRNGSGWIRIKVSMPRWRRSCWAVSSTRGYFGRIGILCCWRWRRSFWIIAFVLESHSSSSSWLQVSKVNQKTPTKL
jgi:hypothetical protein